MINKTILCCCFCCYCMLAAAQQASNVFFNWNVSNSNYPEYWMAEQIAQENNGIIWLGGRGGLVRFDGYHFQPITADINDSTTIPSNYISSILIDENMLYGGTFSNGFFVMNLKTLKATPIPLLGTATGSKFTAFVIAQNGKDSLWIACSKQHLINVDKKTFKQRKNFALKPAVGSIADAGTIFEIIVTKHLNNKLWLLTNKSVLLTNAITGEYMSYTFAGKDKKGADLALENPTSIIEESDSTALIGFFNRGIVQWNFKRNTYKHFLYPVNAPQLTNNIINKMIPKPADEYFVASTDSGLYVFNSQKGIFTRDAPSNLSTHNVFRESTRSLMKDKHGGIWATMVGGISYWHPAYQGVQKIMPPPNLRMAAASSVQHYNNEIVVTRRDVNAPVAVYNLVDQSWFTAPISYFKEDYTRIKLPFRKTFIYQTINGHWAQYQPDTKQIVPFQDPALLLGTIEGIGGIDENDNYVVYSSRNGVYIQDKKNRQTIHHKSSEQKDSLHVQWSRIIKLDQHQQVWIASTFGLSVYDLLSKKFQEISFRTNPGWQGLRIVSDMQLAKNGWLYVATQDDGIFVFDTKSRQLTTQYTRFKLLDEKHVHSILLDSAENYLWVGTHSGVTAIDLRTQQARRWDKHNSGLRFEDGFFGMTLLNNNEVYCSDSNLYHFKLNDVSTIPISPFISGYKVDKHYLNGASVIEIDKEINYIELFVSTGFFADVRHTVIEYSLDNKIWNMVENGKIAIPSLKNGKTTIHLKATLQGVLYGCGESSFVIKRGYFFYQTWWFMALCFIVIAFLIFAFTKIRIQQVRKQEQEKALLSNKINELEIASLRSQMNPHFIFNTLSSLRYLVMTGDNKKASGFIVKLSKLLRMILNHSREETVLLQDELDALQLYIEIESLRFENGFSYKIVTDENIDLFDVRIPPLLLQPYVENAIKHGLVNSYLDEKWVTVTVSNKGGDQLLFSIADNGIGRKNAQTLHASQHHLSVGTAITEQRIQLFNKIGIAKITLTVSELYENEQHPGTLVQILYSSPNGSIDTP